MATIHVCKSMASAAEDAPDSYRDWGSLDPNLLVRIMSLLWPTHREPPRLMLQAMMRACGVCQHWRSLGNALFFSNNSWQGQATIRHPKQLMTLCPPAQAPGGHIRGQVRRESSSRWGLAGRRQRLVLHQGIQSARGQIELCGKFLLAAEQRANGAWAFFLNRKCKGRPVARLTCNSLRTSYTLTATAGGVEAGAGLEAVGSSSSGLQKSGSSSNLQGLSSTTTTSSSSSSSSGSLYSTTSAELGRVSSAKEQQQQQPKLSRHFSWPHQCVMGCKGSACMPTETYGADVLGVSTAGASAAGDSQGAAAAAAAAGSSTAAAVAAGVSPQVLMSLHYKLHLKAMVLPRRMSVMLHIPQQLQQQCADSMAAPAAASAASTCASKSYTSSSSSHSSNAQPAPQAHLVSRAEDQQPAQHSTAHQLSLENKLPHWNDALRVWCLNFNGRVRLSSAKNFQLVSAAADTPQQKTLTQAGDAAAADAEAAPAAGAGVDGVADGAEAVSTAAPAVVSKSTSSAGVVMQFGKTDVDAFILDYNPCITTAMQALAVACTTFGTKLLA